LSARLEREREKKAPPTKQQQQQQERKWLNGLLSLNDAACAIKARTKRIKKKNLSRVVFVRL
jgi:hypothetical protein